MQLSPNFQLSEFVISQTASRYNIDNTPSPSAIANLSLLCKHVMQPLRDHYKLPISISSGYRSPALNKAVGGSPSSQHKTGQACDFQIPSLDNYTVALYMQKNLAYDQLILEFYSGGNSGWIHVAWSSALRNQELTINKYGTFPGLKKY